MAVKKIQKNRLNASGQLDVIHYETSADVVLMEDGTTAEAAIQSKQSKLTLDQAPTANSENPVTSGAVYTALESKQDTLTGQQGQVVGFDAEGNAVAQAAVASEISYDNTKSGLEANTVQGALDEMKAELEQIPQGGTGSSGGTGDPNSDPVGAIRFSASGDLGTEWLLCDGSFISQENYPDLVALLGKLTPGESDLWEAYGGVVGPGVTNSYLYEGVLWAFSITDKKLYGYDGGSKTLKALEVSGSDVLSVSSGNPAYLSICKGHLFLVQNYTSADSFILLDCSNFDGISPVILEKRAVSAAIK